MSGVVVKKCSCKGNNNVSHAAQYQDQRYGTDMRVMNLDVKKTTASCTVCGKDHKI